LDSFDVVEGYRQSAQRLGDLEVPGARTDPQEMARRIAETTREVMAPEAARRRTELRESAGAYGPSSAIAQASAAQEAQSQNYMAQLLAQIAPQLEAQRFNEDIQRISAATGLEQARQGAVRDPYQLINAIRQGYSGQLLGAGAPSAAVPTQYGVPAWSAALQGVGQTAMQVPVAMELANYLRTGQGSPGTGGAPGGSSGPFIPGRYQERYGRP